MIDVAIYVTINIPINLINIPIGLLLTNVIFFFGLFRIFLEYYFCSFVLLFDLKAI